IDPSDKRTLDKLLTSVLRLPSAPPIHLRMRSPRRAQLRLPPPSLPRRLRRRSNPPLRKSRARPRPPGPEDLLRPKSRAAEKSHLEAYALLPSDTKIAALLAAGRMGYYSRAARDWEAVRSPS